MVLADFAYMLKGFCAQHCFQRIPLVPIDLTYSKTILCSEIIIFIVGVP